MLHSSSQRMQVEYMAMSKIVVAMSTNRRRKIVPSVTPEETHFAVTCENGVLTTNEIEHSLHHNSAHVAVGLTFCDEPMDSYGSGFI